MEKPKMPTLNIFILGPVKVQFYSDINFSLIKKHIKFKRHKSENQMLIVTASYYNKRTQKRAIQIKLILVLF